MQFGANKWPFLPNVGRMDLNNWSCYCTSSKDVVWQAVGQTFPLLCRTRTLSALLQQPEPTSGLLLRSPLTAPRRERENCFNGNKAEKDKGNVLSFITSLPLVGYSRISAVSNVCNHYCFFHFSKAAQKNDETFSFLPFTTVCQCLILKALSF